MKRKRRKGMKNERRDEVQVVTVLSQRVSKIRYFTLRWLKKVKIVASSIRLCTRLTASFIAAAYHGWLRKQGSVVRKLKNALSGFIHMVFSQLPSLTQTGAHQSSSLESGGQIFGDSVTIRRPSSNSSSSNQNNPSEEPEASVQVSVLHDPRPRPIRADIIFIHGLHGSLFHTWKQGLWGHRKKVQNLPLEHKFKLDENCEPKTRSEENSLNIRLTESQSQPSHSRTRSQSDKEYDHLLENITDLINNIDDKIKESKNGSTERDTDMEGTTEKGEEPYSTCWPRDWLPKDCPGVRVIAVNYTTDPFLWRPIWVHKRIRSSMTLRSRQMEDLLLELGVGEHPVIWVGHSKGGLFVKQMLVDAGNSEDPRLSKFLKQTKGIMFYSVPHRGSSLARWNLPFLRQSIELTEVKKDCQEVMELHRKFIKLFQEKSLTAEVFSFVETVLTFMFVTNVRVVSVDSADLGLGSFQGVNIDHREICKPLNRDCFLYKELVNLINRVV